MTKVQITRDDLITKGACSSGIAYFDRAYPTGATPVIEWTEAEQIRALRDSAVFVTWAMRVGLLPMLSMAKQDLSGADLSRAVLPRANLRGADLSRANLYGADLSGADLSRADLRWSDLCGANLRETNLSGADLSRANLCWGALPQANLRGADLRGADLSRANLRWANFFGEVRV